MSYDISLHLLTGGTDVTACVFDRNHTSNTARMWRKAGCDLAEFHGQQAAELAAALAPALAQMRANPGDYTPMNPENKWGSYESTVEFLDAIQRACVDFPDATVDVCR